MTFICLISFFCSFFIIVYFMNAQGKNILFFFLSKLHHKLSSNKSCTPNDKTFAGALEKQQFVYVLSRDSANHLTISSPLECHHPDTLAQSVCGTDVGYENPVFAVLEAAQEEASDAETSQQQQSGSEQSTGRIKKQVVFYELDLGLNHVGRVAEVDVDVTAALITQGSTAEADKLLIALSFLFSSFPFLLSPHQHSPNPAFLHRFLPPMTCGLILLPHSPWRGRSRRRAGVQPRQSELRPPRRRRRVVPSPAPRRRQGVQPGSHRRHCAAARPPVLHPDAGRKRGLVQNNTRV